MSRDPQFSQTNHSSSKQAYSFPRAQRLERTKRPICQSIYEIPSTLDKRSASIGFGTRGTRSYSNCPAPGEYENNINTFDYGTKHHRGYTMGVSREKAASKGITAFFRTDSPGPGRFIPKSTLSNIAFTMSHKPKTGGISELLEKNGVPGPGKYINLPGFESKCVISTFKNAPAIKFTTSSAQRFLSMMNGKVPGPGTYQSGIPQSKEGKMFLSTMKNCRSTVISRSNLLKDGQKRESIGPGSYDIPSEFGKSFSRIK